VSKHLQVHQDKSSDFQLADSPAKGMCFAERKTDFDAALTPNQFFCYSAAKKHVFAINNL